MLTHKFLSLESLLLGFSQFSLELESSSLSCMMVVVDKPQLVYNIGEHHFPFQMPRCHSIPESQESKRPKILGGSMSTGVISRVLASIRPLHCSSIVKHSFELKPTGWPLEGGKCSLYHLLWQSHKNSIQICILH